MMNTLREQRNYHQGLLPYVMESFLNGRGFNPQNFQQAEQEAADAQARSLVQNLTSQQMAQERGARPWTEVARDVLRNLHHAVNVVGVNAQTGYDQEAGKRFWKVDVPLAKIRFGGDQ